MCLCSGCKEKTKHHSSDRFHRETLHETGWGGIIDGVGTLGKTKKHVGYSAKVTHRSDHLVVLIDYRDGKRIQLLAYGVENSGVFKRLVHHGSAYFEMPFLPSRYRLIANHLTVAAIVMGQFKNETEFGHTVWSCIRKTAAAEERCWS